MSRREIVDEALAAFAEEGFDGVSLRSLGERVGLHNSSLFHHFRGKREIAQGALERVGEGLLPLLEPLSRDAEPRLETLLRVVGSLCERLTGRPEEARFLLRVLMDPRAVERAGRPGRRTYPALAVRLFTGLSEWLRRARVAGAVRDVQPAQAARQVLGALLLEPALADRSPPDRAGIRARREECVDFVRGALAP